MNKMLITIAAATLLISGCGDKEDAASGQAEPSVVEKTTEPASDATDAASDTASDAAEAAGAVADGGAAGKQLYQKSCQACHATGVANAPKLGDKAAWAPRIATGMDALVASAINGKNVMPPKGTCMSCSDDDLKAAVEYMVSQSQ